MSYLCFVVACIFISYTTDESFIIKLMKIQATTKIKEK